MALHCKHVKVLTNPPATGADKVGGVDWNDEHNLYGDMDDRYYTQAQVDTSLAAKSDTTHNHDLSYAALAHNHDASYSAIGHNHDLAYSAVGHVHAYADLTGKPTLGTAAAADIGSGAGQVAAGNHTHPGGSEAFPVGAVFIAVVDTDPATLLGYGTWSAFGAGRVLVGLNAVDPDFDVAEETGGAKTQTPSAHAGTAVADHASHTHTYTQVPNHVHGVSTILRTATTGGATTQVTNAQDTSSTADTTRKTDNPDGGVATGTTAGPSAVLTHGVTQPNNHSAMSVVQPYIVVYMWKRVS